jgi:hypothetical protein
VELFTVSLVFGPFWDNARKRKETSRTHETLEKGFFVMPYSLPVINSIRTMLIANDRHSQFV